MKKRKTILVTFAGRRDRMGLLARYVDAAIARGLVDEWHVWQFARNDADIRWLRETFPAVQATPNNSEEYFRLPDLLALREDKKRFSFRVRATNDVHIGLRRTSGEGCCYEIVLGGWGNQVSAIRKFQNGRALREVTSRDPQQQSSVARATPGLLREFGFADVQIEIGGDGLKVFFGNAPLLHDLEPIAAGDFEILYRTGYGANGDWRFPQFANHPARLFMTGPEAHHPAGALFYNRAYQYYTANADIYANDIILKCDDDIVYFDLDNLDDFISFRRRNDQYFLVSANVVNNGVCAHFQQSMGAIARNVMDCELPPGGLCGSIWNDGGKAEALHRLFLANPSSFYRPAASPIVWNERVSINFIALQGADLVHIPDLTTDDEHDLCYGVRKRAKKQNCIFPQFIASHLSFWRQEAAMNVDELINDYRVLASDTLANEIPQRAAHLVAAGT